MPDEPYSFAVLRNRLALTGRLVALTALRIGAGRATDVLGNDLPVLRDALGAPFVPGASIKGALRARVEALIRAVAPAQALDLLEIEDRMRAGLVASEDADYDELRGGLLTRREDERFRALRRANRAAQADRELSQMLWDRSTMIDLTFGAPWVAGRVFARDALVDRGMLADSDLVSRLFEVRNGVALNRDTETAEEGLLYDYEVVPAGASFLFELTVENAEPWQLGMILLALEPWRRGEAQIGGFRSRGLGYVRLDLDARRYVEVRGPDDVLRLLGYTSGGNAGDEVSDELARSWFDAFAAKLRAEARREASHA